LGKFKRVWNSRVPVKANEIEAWAAQLERTSQVLSMDAACFREYARLMYSRFDTLAEDAMMAVAARVHGFTVATRNERDFAHFDVAVLNPFKSRAPQCLRRRIRTLLSFFHWNRTVAPCLQSRCSPLIYCALRRAYGYEPKSRAFPRFRRNIEVCAALVG
jgi:hypothetical protein